MRAFTMCLATLMLTYAYLYPGSQALLEGRTNATMSDGTDITAVPFIISTMKSELKLHPARFLYGAIYSEVGDPERGYTIWAPGLERVLEVGLSYIVPIEQVTTAYTALLMLLSICAFYPFGRYLGWAPWPTWGLSLAWGFSYFARARAQVHPSFVGVQHIPLIFLGLTLVARERRPLAIALAALCFLLSAGSPQYFVITAAVLAPLFLIYVYLETNDFKNAFLRLALATLPAVLYLGLSLKFPIPADAKISAADAFPATGQTAPGTRHPFLSWFGARPIDYITGNLGLSRGPIDVNPLKTLANESVFQGLTESNVNGNTHERTNGIHWVVWALAIAALASARPTRTTWFFVALAITAFALSLAPGEYGPAAWLNHLVSQIRVPSRAGLWVHFALLVLAGSWLKDQRRAWLRAAFVIPALIVLEDPPFYQTLNLAPIEPAYAELAQNQTCGIGMYFPFANKDIVQVPYYRFLQRLRGDNRCQFLNALEDGVTLRQLTNLFPPAETYLRNLANDFTTPTTLTRLAACVPLSYVVFDAAVSPEVQRRLCAAMNFELHADGVCLSPHPGAPLAKPVRQCL